MSDRWFDEFEQEWRNGLQPLIEAYLPQANPDEIENALFRFLNIELFYRASNGSLLPDESYLNRFPEYQSIVNRALLQSQNHHHNPNQAEVDDQTRVDNSAEDNSAEDNYANEAPLEDLPTQGSQSDILRPPSAPRFYRIDPNSIQTNQPPAPQRQEAEIPDSFGRYHIISLLGSGGFGQVYRATDKQLQRNVAIKVTKTDLLDENLRQSFLTEARIVAGLDHPHIVPVYDVGQTNNGDFFVVSKLIDGVDLATRIKSERPDRLLSLRIVSAIAQALQYAHSQGLVHRDVKPANILIDRSDRPYLTDFGLALRESEFGKQAGYAGTPAYMSPEQARGEGHRVDNRSDIYSLGVVLYELLTGRRPFRSDNARELMSLIASEEARSPRLFDDSLSVDMERICLKALSRRASDRFTVARDFAEELNWVLTNQAPTPGLVPATLDIPGSTISRTPLNTPITPSQGGSTPSVFPSLDSQPTGPTRVVPKGLRSFDAADADFFLELLPGPFDREGLPEGIRFWKTKIEETEPERTFKVGVIYGPSGCGKSSLMKAGLLPWLGRKIIPIYLEATPGDTDIRLLHAVRKAIPEAEGGSLKEVLSLIRRRKLVPTGGKLLLVLDQFEQWLYAKTDYARASLTEALLQCDGAAIQAIIMVREDFWISVSRFLRELDVPLVERENSGMVDLFDLDHAAKVMGMFGRAYGKLPDSSKEWTADQHEFIRQAVEGLSQERKVISVRLSVFSDMMKSRPWTTAALREVGGIEGIGVTFLEETFGSKHAPIQHRQHQTAVRGLLAALLPTTGSDIKGDMRSSDQLRTAAGYDRQPRDFQDLITILDKNLRLITPVDLEGDLKEKVVNLPAEVQSEDDKESSERSEKSVKGVASNTSDSKLRTSHFILSHDYLVPSLREWLTRKQRETKKGRAELKLAERAATWAANPENKQLPTLWEWLTIRRLTEKAKWRPAEQAVMRRSSRFHLTRSALIAGLLVLISAGGWWTWDQVESNRQTLLAQKAAEQEATRIEGLVGQLLSADPDRIPEIVKQLDSNPELTDQLLQPYLMFESPTLQQQHQQLHARLAAIGRDSALVHPLWQSLLTERIPYISTIREQLREQRENLIPIAQQLLRDRHVDQEHRFRAALALADYLSKNDPWWEPDDFRLVGRHLVAVNPELQPQLRRLIQPLAPALQDEFSSIFSDAEMTAAQRLGAGNAIADFYAMDSILLARLVCQADPEPYGVLFPFLAAQPSEEAIGYLIQQAATLPPDELGSIERIDFGRQRANAALTLLRLGREEEALAVCQKTDDPEAISQFLARLRSYNVALSEVISCWNLIQSEIRASDPVAVKYLVLLALGEYSAEELSEQQRESILEIVADWYAHDPSSGAHGAAGWLLRQWGWETQALKIDQTPVPYSTDREWFTLAVPSNSHRNLYFTFIVFPAGKYTIGSVADEPARSRDEIRHTVELSRPFALLDRQTTFEEFIAFNQTHREIMERIEGGSLEASVGGLAWYESVSFCRWLNTQMGWSEQVQPYADPDSLDVKEYPREAQPGWDWAPRNWPLDLGKSGFRLPTEAEWESACRSGHRTAYSFGSDSSLLNRYGWFAENSEKRVQPPRGLRPDLRGLYDTHGNVFEWIHDWSGEFGNDGAVDPTGAAEGSGRVYRGGCWNFDATFCRTAIRIPFAPSFGSDRFGFRLALSPSSQVLAEPESDEKQASKAEATQSSR